MSTPLTPAAPLVLGLLLLCGGAALSETRKVATPYPKAPVSDVVEEYHGVKVPDPYRKLEDPDAPETRDWIESENELTQAYLEKIPERKPIRQRLTKLW